MTVFPGKTAFRLYDTYGFPIEMTQELAKEKGYTLDKDGYDKAFADHQALSKAGAEQELTTRLHSATHLLNAALKLVLHDDSIQQKGSNITSERLRFDFNFPRPLTQEEIAEVEKVVNDEIAKDSEIKLEEMSVEEAKNAGAIFFRRRKTYQSGFGVIKNEVRHPRP